MKEKNSIHSFVILAYKESEFLEECIKSTLNQSVKTDIMIATTTDNKYIRNLAKKYNLKVVVGKHTSIGGDFNFALNSSNSRLVTIAHQDDIYDSDYVKEIIKNYNKYSDSLIIFSDYYEIRKGKKVFTNLNLKIKRILLSSLLIKKLSGFKFLKRNVLRLGNSICCPAVTYVKNNNLGELFTSDFKSNVDWDLWERLSKKKGKFIFINKKLMGHRVDESTTTTSTIKEGIRTKEDLIILRRFWSNGVAKIINRLFSYSEKSNGLK